jgi:hypothetical protein
MKRADRRPLLLLVLVAALAQAPGMTAHGAAGEAGNDLAISNQFLELHFQRQGERVAATALVNRIAGRTIHLAADDFALKLEGRPTLHAENFTVREVAREKLPAGQRLTLHLVQGGGTSKVALVYELLDDSFFLRRHVEFSPGAPVLLREVEVWKVGLEGRCSHQETGPPEEMLHNVWGVDRKTGFGKPVFLEDTFWGLEFPAGYNHYACGYLTLSHLPGRKVAETFISKTAVLGVAPPDQVARHFRSYIEQGRSRPRQPEVQVDYNTWTTVTPATESNSLALIRQFQQHLFEPYGVSFDSFTLDDGWDEKHSLWQLRTNGFPHGFTPLLDALQPIGTKLGLWLSPSSGYEHADWGGQNGYTRNATFDWFLCQSDPAYRREICRVVPELIRNHDVGFFKMDGFCASCDTHRHDHHLDGDFAREANVDAFIELLSAMRKAKPGVYLDPTSGMWLSPWWLWYVDSVYADTYDGTAPAIVPSPNGFDGATSIRDALLRRRLAANPGFDPAAVETLGVYLDPTLAIAPQTFFDHWQDNAMMVAGRGNRLLTFYMNPALFPNPPKDWAFLAGMIQWARHNAPTLARTEMILGDPYRMEAYGYAHFRGRRGILALRNPFIQPQTVRLKLDESCGWMASDAGTGTYAAAIVFPYHETLRPAFRHGDPLELELQPYQTLIVQIETTGEASPTLAGVRAREVSRASGKISWEVFGLSGTKLSVPVAGLPKPGKILWDGQPIKSVATRQGVELPLTFAGEKKHCFAEGGSLRADPGPGGAGRLLGSCNATIPKGTTASVYVLCLDPSPAATEFKCRATIAGIAVPATAIQALVGSKTTLRLVRELPLKPWVFFRFPVPEGKSKITISLESASPQPRALAVKAGWWLWTEQPLQKAALTLEFDPPLPAAPVHPLPFPSALEFQRQVLTLQPLKSFL